MKDQERKGKLDVEDLGPDALVWYCILAAIGIACGWWKFVAVLLVLIAVLAICLLLGADYGSPEGKRFDDPAQDTRQDSVVSEGSS